MATYEYKGKDIIAPFNIASNQPVISTDTTSLQSQRVVAGGQRWELEFQVKVSESTDGNIDAADFLADSVLSSNLHTAEEMVMPQLTTSQGDNIDIALTGFNADGALGIQNVGFKGATTVDINGITEPNQYIPKAQFIQFDGDDKIYMTTERTIANSTAASLDTTLGPKDFYSFSSPANRTHFNLGVEFSGNQYRSYDLVPPAVLVSPRDGLYYENTQYVQYNQFTSYEADPTIGFDRYNAGQLDFTRTGSDSLLGQGIVQPMSSLDTLEYMDIYKNVDAEGDSVEHSTGETVWSGHKVYKGWESTVTYAIGDTVVHDFNHWGARAINTNVEPGEFVDLNIWGLYAGYSNQEPIRIYQATCIAGMLGTDKLSGILENDPSDTAYAVGETYFHQAEGSSNLDQSFGRSTVIESTEVSTFITCILAHTASERRSDIDSAGNQYLPGKRIVHASRTHTGSVIADTKYWKCITFEPFQFSHPYGEYDIAIYDGKLYQVKAGRAVDGLTIVTPNADLANWTEDFKSDGRINIKLAQTLATASPNTLNPSLNADHGRPSIVGQARISGPQTINDTKPSIGTSGISLVSNYGYSGIEWVVDSHLHMSPEREGQYELEFQGKSNGTLEPNSNWIAKNLLTANNYEGSNIWRARRLLGASCLDHDFYNRIDITKIPPIDRAADVQVLTFDVVPANTPTFSLTILDQIGNNSITLSIPQQATEISAEELRENFLLNANWSARVGPDAYFKVASRFGTNQISFFAALTGQPDRPLEAPSTYVLSVTSGGAYFALNTLTFVSGNTPDLNWSQSFYTSNKRLRSTTIPATLPTPPGGVQPEDVVNSISIYPALTKELPVTSFMKAPANTKIKYVYTPDTVPRLKYQDGVLATSGSVKIIEQVT